MPKPARPRQVRAQINLLGVTLTATATVKTPPAAGQRKYAEHTPYASPVKYGGDS